MMSGHAKWLRFIALVYGIGFCTNSKGDDGPDGPPVNLVCYVDSTANCADATAQIAAETGLFQTSCGTCYATIHPEDGAILQCSGEGQSARIANMDLTIEFAFPRAKGPGVAGKESVTNTGQEICGTINQCLRGCYLPDSQALPICRSQVTGQYPLPTRIATGVNCTAAGL